VTTETETTTNAAETATTTAAADTSTTETREVTLDDVYREAGLDKLVTLENTQREETTKQEPQKVEPSSIPSAYDEENFKAFLARQATGTTELEKAVKAMAGYLTEQQRQAAAQATRADIEKAVEAINEVVKHPKSKVIEAALDGMVREDPRLKAIWSNRAKNPTAWNNALKIVTKSIAEDFSVKVDPNLVAAQRARKDAQKQMATTNAPDEASPVEERLGKAQGADFDLEWQRLVSGVSRRKG
jgi:hypothetical protein